MDTRTIAIAALVIGIVVLVLLLGLIDVVLVDGRRVHGCHAHSLPSPVWGARTGLPHIAVMNTSNS